MAAQPSTSTSASTPTPSATPVGATASASSAAASANGNDDASQADAQAKPAPAVLVRDKESFQKLMVERYVTRDWENQAAQGIAMRYNADSFQRYNDKIAEYRIIRETHRQHFPPARLYGEGYAEAIAAVDLEEKGHQEAGRAARRAGACAHRRRHG
ncbi:hypothetical protein HYQ46_002919 [Verticillium longisporum]|nr:hypothetical protein HYQ46_002919 [Verticillium longisporum]